MNKVKNYFPIYKNLTHEQMRDLINEKFPINLRYNEDLVDRVHKKFGSSTKTDVAIVIKAAFESVRDLIILNKTISLLKLFQSFRLFYYAYNAKEKLYTTATVKLVTPKGMK